MRYVFRPPPSTALGNQLASQTQRIARRRTHGTRRRAADTNWPNAGKVRLMRELIAMNRGHDRCMYCEYSEAGTVDHFNPKSIEPLLCFEWDNLVLACGRCQAAKVDSFTPDLLNPSDPTYRPWHHLDFDPTSGEYVPAAPRGTASATIYAWGRGKLPEYRKKSFRVFQAAVIAYETAAGAGDHALCQFLREIAVAESHPGVLDWIIYWADAGDPHGYLDPRCVAAVAAHLEIRTWC
jgi:hypothetical protein